MRRFAIVMVALDPAGTLTDGPYRETMEPAGPGRLWGAPERDGCHVETVELEADMVPMAAVLL